MPALIFTILAPIGAWIHLRRHPEPRGRARTLETHLVWWLALAIGAGGVIGALFHIFDGAQIAREIGFTRGDGGFQFENAMGDMALGVVGLLCIRYRGNFLLAAVLVTAIQYYGDAYGHVYQWLENDNTKPDNVGIPLWLDVIQPTVAIVLYAALQRARRGTPSGSAGTDRPAPTAEPTSAASSA